VNTRRGSIFFMHTENYKSAPYVKFGFGRLLALVDCDLWKLDARSMWKRKEPIVECKKRIVEANLDSCLWCPSCIMLIKDIVYHFKNK